MNKAGPAKTDAAQGNEQAKLPRDSIELIVFDFDGVLTDNRVLVFEDGREAVLCNRADGLGFGMLRDASLATLTMSTETNPVVAVRAKKLGVPVLQALTDKADSLKKHCEATGIPVSKVMFVGNDINDLGVMNLCGYPVAVADAHETCKAAA